MRYVLKGARILFALLFSFNCLIQPAAWSSPAPALEAALASFQEAASRGLSFDLASAALEFSQAASRDLWGRETDFDGARSKIDAMVREVRADLAGETDPGLVLRTLNRYFFEDQKFAFDDAHRDGRKDEAILLDLVLDQKKGYCLSLSVLYFYLAERLGLPVKGVAAPGHFFVRLEFGPQPVNAEITRRGQSQPDAAYREEFKIPETDPYYLTSLDKREVLGVFLDNLALVYRKKGFVREAEVLYASALALNPRYASTRLSLGNLQFDAGRMDQALAYYRQAVQTDPGNGEAYYRMGLVYGRKGLTEEEIKAYQKAVRLNARDAKIYAALANAYGKKGLLDASIFASQKALSLDPKQSEAYHSLALAHFFKGQRALAVLYCMKARALGAVVRPRFLKLLNL